MDTDQKQQLPELKVPPSPAQQREIITTLERETESTHAYFVATSWYKIWKNYVGLNKSKETEKENKKTFKLLKEHKSSPVQDTEKPCDNGRRFSDINGANVLSSREKRRRKQKGSSLDLSAGDLPDLERANQDQGEGNRHSKMTPCQNGSGPNTNGSYDQEVSTNPGPVTMDTEDAEQNILIDEKIWLKWLEWYGLATSHQLDRRNWSSQEKYFEVCLLSPYSSIVENPLKVLDTTETVAYLEVQIRKMYGVPLHKKSRLWICEKARHARFKLILDRECQLINAKSLGFNQEKDYILAVEVATAQGAWPTSVPGQPSGDLTDLLMLYRDNHTADYWVQELTQTVDSVLTGISNEMKETAEGIVQTAKCVTGMRENELQEVKQNLGKMAREAEELEKYLDNKSAELVLEERNLKQAVSVVKQEREFLDDEKQKLRDEIKKMEELNKISESRVKLDVGGHVYTTSVLTLTKDQDSMLAAMFSGRHSLVKEEDGSYFLDRDGTHFRYILNFLRDGGFREGTLPNDKGTLMELLTEAEYYQITGIVKCLNEHLKVHTVSVSRSFSEDRRDSSDEEASSATKKPLRRVAYRREITSAT